MVFEIEDKLFRIKQILSKNPQPSIIYVRNRRACIDTAEQLNSLGFKATYYHGGLSTKDKNNNMQLWMEEKALVMVATNAFGMGIDKANVKTVIHIQLPENLENYYQEAGRAGRNEEKAFAVLLTNPSDVAQTENQFIYTLSDKQFLKEVFIKMCNYFQIAYGEGINEQYSFNLNQFCNRYKFPVLKTYNAIQFLDRQGVISLSQEFSEKISLQFIIPSKEVIRYTSLNPNDEEILLAILRTYPGVYDMQTNFNLPLIARKSKHSEAEVQNVLEKLKEKGIIDYHSKNNDTTLIFNEIREDERTISRIAKYLENQNQLKKEQFEAVLNYIKKDKVCKSKLILEYFGEKKESNCGICSYCITQKKKKESKVSLSDEILNLLKTADFNSREIQIKLNNPSDDVIFALQELLENESILIKSNNKYSLKQ